jgi:hypothetical protein
MPNRPQPSPGGSSEYSNERSIQHAERAILPANITEEQIFIDYLLEEGFILEEATRLLHLRDHLHENAEMRQRMDNDYRMHFVKWLYEQGEISEQ